MEETQEKYEPIAEPEILKSLGSRNKIQRTATFVLYDILTYIDMNEAIPVENIVSSMCQAPYSESDLFVKKVAINAIKNLDSEIALLNQNMRKWTFKRLNRVEQAILLLSVTHYYYVDTKIEKGIVIDVAVKLAKAYLEDNDYKFVNAILDKVLVNENR